MVNSTEIASIVVVSILCCCCVLLIVPVTLFLTHGEFRDFLFGLLMYIRQRLCNRAFFLSSQSDEFTLLQEEGTDGDGGGEAPLSPLVRPEEEEGDGEERKTSGSVWWVDGKKSTRVFQRGSWERYFERRVAVARKRYPSKSMRGLYRKIPLLDELSQYVFGDVFGNVLEIGPGNGDLFRILRHNKRIAHWMGIEPNVTSAAFLRNAIAHDRRLPFPCSVLSYSYRHTTSHHPSRAIVHRDEAPPEDSHASEDDVDVRASSTSNSPVRWTPFPDRSPRSPRKKPRPKPSRPRVAASPRYYADGNDADPSPLCRVPNNSVDFVVVRHVFCSVSTDDGAESSADDDMDLPSEATRNSSLEKLLKELLRIVRPGGEIRLVEHIRYRDQPSARCFHQSLCHPCWRLCCGNCHLDRDLETVLQVSQRRMEWGGLQRAEFTWRNEFEYAVVPVMCAAVKPHLFGKMVKVRTAGKKRRRLGRMDSRRASIIGEVLS